MKRKMIKFLSMIIALSIVLSSIGFESNASSISNRRKQFDKLYIKYAIDSMCQYIKDSKVSYAPSNKTHRSELTPKQKKYYDEFLKKIKNIEEFDLHNSSHSDRQREYRNVAYLSILGDYPWYQNILESYHEEYKDGEYRIHLYYKTPSGKKVKSAKDKRSLKKQLDLYDKTIEDVSDHIIEMMPDNLSTIDKYRYLAVVLCECTKYNKKYLEIENNPKKFRSSKVCRNKSTKYGPLLFGTGVCSGYSEAYKYLCNRAGLYCETVTGKPVNSGESYHEWNMVKLKSGTYYIDVTWMDNNPFSQMIDYSEFMQTEKEMRKTHSEYTWTEKATGKKSYRKIIDKAVNPEV